MILPVRQTCRDPTCAPTRVPASRVDSPVEWATHTKAANASSRETSRVTRRPPSTTPLPLRGPAHRRESARPERPRVVFTSRGGDVDADQVEMGRCVEQMPIVGIDTIHTVLCGTGAMNRISGTKRGRHRERRKRVAHARLQQAIALPRSCFPAITASAAGGSQLLPPTSPICLLENPSCR